MWELLYVILMPLERRRQAKAAQQQAAAAQSREAIAAERIAQGYRRVIVQNYGAFDFFSGAVEEKDWFVPGWMAQHFEDARSQALVNYNELVGYAWNRYIGGEIFSYDYRKLCETAQHAYRLCGEGVERALVARGISPASARFAREHFYDYRFPYIADPPMLLFQQGHTGARPARPRSPDAARPMKDVTPPKPQLRGGRTYH